MLRAIKEGDGSGTLKQDMVRIGTEIVNGTINLLDGASCWLDAKGGPRG